MNVASADWSKSPITSRPRAGSGSIPMRQARALTLVALLALLERADPRAQARRP